MGERIRLSEAQSAALADLASRGRVVARSFSGGRYAIVREVEPSTAQRYGRWERVSCRRYPTLAKLRSLGLIEMERPGDYVITENGRKLAGSAPGSQT